MNNHSITASAINIYLFEAHQTKTRVAQAKAEYKSSDPKDEVLLGVVTNYFVMAQQYTVVETIASSPAISATTERAIPRTDNLDESISSI